MAAPLQPYIIITDAADENTAGTYQQAAYILLGQAAETLSVEEFQSNQELSFRFLLYQRRALCALMVARQIACNSDIAEDVTFLEQRIGEVLYEELRSGPPLSDMLSQVTQVFNKKCREGTACACTSDYCAVEISMAVLSSNLSPSAMSRPGSILKGRTSHGTQPRLLTGHQRGPQRSGHTFVNLESCTENQVSYLIKDKISKACFDCPA